MQYLNPILNLPEFEIKSVQDRHVLVFDVRYRGKKQCGHCQSSKVRIKASYIRQLKHHLIGHVPSVLSFKAHKLIVIAVKGILINVSLVLELIKGPVSLCSSKSFINILMVSHKRGCLDNLD